MEKHKNNPNEIKSLLFENKKEMKRILAFSLIIFNQRADL
jgi:hypothetical protein